MPQSAAAPAHPLRKHAHRPEPIEPPTAPPTPGESDTVPDPSPQPIEPVDPPPQPTQTPQASRRPPISLRV
ncbi:MAG: FIG00463164: hypothetical protein [uncultured Paraburkholderia sp.]|nr:MAG: FIG00463164: hypothetical protein [uncultured Paraburkholderia sp.]CAH2793927.1 MAG: FIG00463164: hypothetical protein [uncultured Paraburkholderia sp.]CAH2928577.1 MAG: FIG00463164: hypothetical protein [uncultured Paraburkholderia sp.]CAH2929342.1 MAG: FIG00463164: hypothetical protein [uncultured Paraburkholderia sp.]